MYFEDDPISKNLKYQKLEFSFGNYYFCEQFVVSEIYEGIHLDWDKILEVVGAAMDYYGNTIKIAYISNRMESYSVEPQLWLRFQQEFGFIVAVANVTYNDFGYLSATFEKAFTKLSLKRCSSLEEAFGWVYQLSEFSSS